MWVMMELADSPSLQEVMVSGAIAAESLPLKEPGTYTVSPAPADIFVLAMLNSVGVYIFSHTVAPAAPLNLDRAPPRTRLLVFVRS
tara:strand:- start:188 stop:445 length:258 start_codon:yes stop_codon:yes gene_type:complete